MKKGFTLVELSIVLVIIGLLTGGILVAQSLIDSAKINRVISISEQYIIATRFFHERYRGLPGDSSYAARVFGESPNSWSGQNNGALSWDEGSHTSNSTEDYIAWKQMSLSGLIPKNADTVDGNYTGIGTLKRVDQGVNVPFSETFPTASWNYIGYPNYRLGYTSVASSWSSIRLAGVVDGPSNTYPQAWNGPLTVAQVLSIDSKVDDGLPGQGDVMHHAGNSAIWPCVSGTNRSTATYDLNQEGEVCHVVFWLPDF